jgi:NAD(P)H-dependent flavin oxidoreductase YrpB (nitropropane dioxygenase family)
VAHFWEEAHTDVCLEERVPVVVFFWCLPSTLVPRLHARGTKVWIQVGSVLEAREAVRDGADAVIVQGSEAGGHNRGAAATFPLVPAVVDAIAPVPVIAAGGIADGRGVAAALALGADAVWVGTRLVASREAYAHDEYKRRILAATEADTIRTTMFGREWPRAQTRVLRNRVVNEWAGRESEIPPSSDPPQLIGRTVVHGQEMPMPKFSVLLPTPDTTGDIEEMCLLSGESAGLVRDIRPAGEIVRDMMAEAHQVILGHLLPMAGGASPNEA